MRPIALTRPQTSEIAGSIAATGPPLESRYYQPRCRHNSAAGVSGRANRRFSGAAGTYRQKLDLL